MFAGKVYVLILLAFLLSAFLVTLLETKLASMELEETGTWEKEWYIDL